MSKESAVTTPSLSSSASPKRQKVDKEQDLKTVEDIVDDLMRKQQSANYYLRPIINETNKIVNKQLIPWDDIYVELIPLLKQIYDRHNACLQDVVNYQNDDAYKWSDVGYLKEHYYKLLQMLPKAPILLKAGKSPKFKTCGIIRPHRKPLMNFLRKYIYDCLNGFKELKKLKPSEDMDKATKHLSDLFENFKELPDVNYMYGYPGKKLKEAGKLIMRVPCTVKKHFIGIAGGKSENNDLFVFENTLLFCKQEDIVLQPFLFKFLYSVKLEQKKPQVTTKAPCQPDQICMIDGPYKYVITVQNPTLRDDLFKTVKTSKSKQKILPTRKRFLCI